MGLIKAGIGALGGTLADQWKEFFYCEAMPKEVLVTKGQKRVSGRSSNTKASDNIISNGSGIAVADGQCMIIVEQGKVVEVCAEPGEFTYDTSTEPSIFSGSLGEGIKQTFKTIGKRFTYGGDTGKDQRVYYFNTKELIDNKFGTPNPIPFRVVDSKIGLDVDVSVRCSGVYSYKIADPLLFYTNVCGNVEKEYTRDELDGQLKTEFISALQPAFGKLSDMEMRPNQIVSHNTELENAMNTALSAKWGELRGLAVVSIALGSVTLPEEDAEMIKQAQRTAIMRDPTMAAATLVGAQADAMKAAASNEAGAMTGFMGMGMAAGANGMNAQNLFAMGQQPAAPQQQTSAADSWKCSCGATVTGKFCPECGSKKPEPKPADSWICSCGATVTGKFCPECGKRSLLPATREQRKSFLREQTALLRPKTGEKHCGDQCAVFDAGGLTCLVLSDGMGSGESAHCEAAMTIRLLRQFLQAGIEPLPALKTLNTAAMLRCQGGAGFTTIDLACLDRAEGVLTLYKYGAAPSYIKRQGTVARYRAQALPAGLESADGDVPPQRVAVSPGTWLVQVSDGVAGEDDEWLQDLLAGWDGTSPRALAEELLRQSVQRTGGADDCAVLVLAIDGKADPHRV